MMNKNILYHLSGLSLLALLLVWGLYWNAGRPYQIKNGFERKLVKLTGASMVIGLPVAATGISFDGLRYCYFYASGLRNKVWRLDLINLKRDSLEISWPGPVKGSSNFKLMADGAHLYLQYQNQRDIFSYSLSEKRIGRHGLIKMPGQQVLTEKQRLIMRCSDFGANQPILLKQGLIAGGLQGMVRPWPDERMGLIPTDGEMHFDPVSKLLSYHYFYKNGFMVWNEDLEHLTAGKTIDTVAKGNVRVNKFGGAFTLAGPPKFINGQGCADAGKLYINAYLKADNENTRDFINHTVIDVYDMINGRYLYSFYVPVFREQKLNCFEVRAGKLICLYGNDVVIYKMKMAA
ncbi:hypothetical protein HDC92_000600 [Pedobacter sp. AK017]|uniref:hypothetical protein n=1 Tax=Pedobacter sp. AK017 TaxID=2723073 RepID=UPI001619939B|nr:hypothetical protein [Pedobacter sp. AK017]MBB5436936.1 hypothetical protein [Pedobacter sp. AK017]